MAVPSPINPINYIVNREYVKKPSIKTDLFDKRLACARNLYRKDLFSHYGCVNAIEFSNEGELLISGGDDRRVLLWSVPHAILNQGKPVIMLKTHHSNIFCLGFDSKNTKIFSAGNDDQVIVHDIRTCSFVTNFQHEKPVYGLSVNPENDYVFASAGEDGRILIFDIRETSNAEPLCLARYKTAFHAVMFNPIDPRFVASANTEEGIALWDNRNPKTPVLRYGGSFRRNSGMSVRFNALGTQLLALRRRLPPVLYSIHSEKPVCQFYHEDYYNSCTMKSCCFAGKHDEYVLSGSDDFNLYMWRIPKDDAEWGPIHMELEGHRSIVNQVRYNRQNNIIASSGVEKMVKLWSTLPIGGWKGSLLQDDSDKPRQVFSHEEYISLVQNNGQLVSHDYSHQSTQEDSRMMAFFDSLVQREIEGWVMSDDTASSDSECDFSMNLSIMSQLPPESHRCLSPNKKGNRIAQLIFEKRERLAKMAQQKFSGSRKYKSREKQRKRKSMKSKSLCHKGSSKSSSSVHGRKSHKQSSHKCTISNSELKSKQMQKHKYQTRYNVAREREEVQSSESLDMPSTSTGITASNSSLYRIFEQDSDEETNEVRSPNEPSDQPLINILPTPLNGTHDMYINILQVPVSNGNNVIAVRNELINYEPDVIDRDSESSSDELEEVRTPNGKYRTQGVITPDSGIITGPCSSSGSVNSVYNSVPCGSGTSTRYAQQLDDGSDDPDWGYQNVKKRVKNPFLDYRNNYGFDSDSN